MKNISHIYLRVHCYQFYLFIYLFLHQVQLLAAQFIVYNLALILNEQITNMKESIGLLQAKPSLSVFSLNNNACNCKIKGFKSVKMGVSTPEEQHLRLKLLLR